MVINRVLITGSSGQLGQAFYRIRKLKSETLLIFKNKYELDIGDKDSLNYIVKKYNIDSIINCAAYTNVEDSIYNKDICNKINNTFLQNIIDCCKINNLKLVHFSTDYVFDGLVNSPYKENDDTNPLNYYGTCKLSGEKRIIDSGLENSIIIRTSWLYSLHSKNFVNQIIEKLNKFKIIEVVDDQFGSPTNANDLAKAILKIIPLIKNKSTEIYHYANLGLCSRFELAINIASFFEKKKLIISKKTDETLVNRPKYSVLNSEKFMHTFKIKGISWQKSLSNYLKNNF